VLLASVHHQILVNFLVQWNKLLPTQMDANVLKTLIAKLITVLTFNQMELEHAPLLVLLHKLLDNMILLALALMVQNASLDFARTICVPILAL